MSAPPGSATRHVCPVYATAQQASAGRLDSANTGLVFDRYADPWSGPPAWQPATGDRGGPSARQQFLAKVCDGAARSSAAVRPLLSALHQRRAARWAALQAQVLEFALAAPLVSGLGMTHALEAGFVWERNLGVPYLPASSVKGATRAWAEQWLDVDGVMLHRLFGDLETTGAGVIGFDAAYPTEAPTLRLDVLNPHFGAYCRGVSAPGDWLSPEPVFFLTVTPGASFRTAVWARPGAQGDDLAQAAGLVVDALTNLGIGSKTALGYGRFSSKPTVASTPTTPTAQSDRLERPPTGKRPVNNPAPPAPRDRAPGPAPDEQRPGPATLEDLVRRFTPRREHGSRKRGETRESQRARGAQRRINEWLRGQTTEDEPPKGP